ncbi:leucine-rich repeat domain-containing protein [uncultured Legionella sp.]|uniref:leucine-rich repeat domain-containing protein n=1 Tax=uncultured Legionella sp. TaxID=210934 RepID=UPI0026182A96|nr:leucine-rich repeat domain-containing protein [uncultured Legionella sp.]
MFTPHRTTYLSLANNKLIYVDPKTLAAGFDCLPPNLTYLDLSNNYIQYDLPDTPIYNPYQVKSAFSHLPASLTHLDFKGNFHPKTTDEQLIPFLKELPETLESITISPGGTIDLAAWHTLEHLLCLVESEILNKEKIDKFSFNKKELQISVQLNEYRLNQFIALLEKMNTPLSLLLCGFLLEGRIPNHVEEKEDLSTYMEKRLHDAISFYEKILIHPSKEEQVTKCIKPLAEFLLWEIKTVSDTPSVINRLKAYCISPDAILGIIYSSNILADTHKNQAPAQVTLTNEARFFSSNKRSNAYKEEHVPKAKRMKRDTVEQMDEEIPSTKKLCSFFPLPQDDEHMAMQLEDQDNPDVQYFL